MKTRSSLESLETRIAPASLLSASAFSYTDIDGDAVTVTFTKGILTPANFDTLVTISDGLAGTGFQDLIRLDLFSLGLTGNGLGIKVVAAPSRQFGGDGMISGLEINASEVVLADGTGDGIDLGIVSIDGDINYIDAGDGDDLTLSIKSLTVKSVGLNSAGVPSDIYGPTGPLKVSGNFAGSFNVDGNNVAVPHIKSFTIGGSIFGNLGDDAGRIEAFGGIGPVKIGGDVIGGDSVTSGSIFSFSHIASVSIKGSLMGGDGAFTGTISGFSLGPIKLGGSLKGGNGANTGVIEAIGGDIRSVTITGSIYGGPGNRSGVIEAGDLNEVRDGSIGNVLIKGSVIGFIPDSGEFASGVTIRADNSIGKVTVLGALVNANIVAGVHPGADLEYGTADDSPTTGLPGADRSLGPVIIKNGISATTPGFAITALKIASIQAGGPTLKPGGPFVDFTTGFVIGGGSGLFVIDI